MASRIVLYCRITRRGVYMHISVAGLICNENKNIVKIVFMTSTHTLMELIMEVAMIN